MKASGCRGKGSLLQPSDTEQAADGVGSHCLGMVWGLVDPVNPRAGEIDKVPALQGCQQTFMEQLLCVSDIML